MTPLLPRLDGRALDAVKAVAAVTMVVDHVGSLWYHRAYPWMDAVGRVSFPLFAYAAAVAALRAGDRADRGLARLLLLAIVVEPIARACRPELPIANVLFTLALGTALAAGWSALGPAARGLAVVAAAAGTAFPPAFEFGLAGALLPAALAAVLRGERGAWAVAAGLVPTLNVAQLHWVLTRGPAPLVREVATRGVRDALIVAVVPLLVVHACARAAPGEGRLLPKYFLHVFYPAHLVALWAFAPR